MIYYDSDQNVHSMTYTTEHLPSHPATELTPAQEATLQHGLSKWCWAPELTSHATASKIDFTTYHIPSTYDLYYMLRTTFLQYERQRARWWTRWFGSRSPLAYTSFPDEIHILLDTSLMMLTGANVSIPFSSKFNSSVSANPAYVNGMKCWMVFYINKLFAYCIIYVYLHRLLSD